MTKLPFPIEVLDQHVIILAKTRSGKSSAMRLIAESLLDDGKPVCIIDPKGDWWGTKSSADGKKAGYPIVIFGGEHADVPINEHSGAHVAELVATGNRPCLIDLGGWYVGDRTRFFINFAETLFKLNRGIRHLIIDEVHNFAPKGKVMSPDAGIMLHWANRLASEGLGRGINIVAASQRPQKVHNNFLDSCETLIAMRVIHPSARIAMKEWVDGCADPEVGKEVLGSLAKMERGEAWVWSPEAGFGPARIKFPMFSTYDSFKPQNITAGKLEGWAEVDLDEVRAKLSDVVKESEANDPKALKAEIARLKRELESSRNQQQAAEVEIKEVSVLTDADKQYLSNYLETIEKAAATIEENTMATKAANDSWVETLGHLSSSARTLIDGLRHAVSGGSLAPAVSIKAEAVTIHGDVSASGKRVGELSPRKKEEIRERSIHDFASSSDLLGKCHRAILTVLAQHGPCEKTKLAMLSGYAYSGTFRRCLGELRTMRFINGGNDETMSITDAGLLALGDYEPLPTGKKLREYWLSKVGKCHAAILQALFDHPGGLSKEQLCEFTGYEYSGTFRRCLGELRTADLIIGKNDEVMKASPHLLK
jgi:uncharacterized protein